MKLVCPILEDGRAYIIIQEGLTENSTRYERDVDSKDNYVLIAIKERYSGA